MGGFWQRLKQRKLVQWAIAWVAFAFALLQGIDIVAQRFDWPPAIERYLILALIVGFFVVLVLAWYHGEKGRQRIGGMEIMILALLLAIGGALIWRFGPAAVLHAHAPSVASSSATPAIPAQAIPAKSIAVLPFQNLSNDKDNAYFVEGMQDLILTKLADIGGLKVIARTSTAKYASRPEDLKTIGQQLGVATILEGSVQKAGDQVLINVQLIDTRTDSHVWAQDYTRTLDNVFGVEGDVAQKIAAALKAKLSPAQSAELAAAPTTNRAALDAFWRAEYLANRGVTNSQTGTGKSDVKAAIPLYRQAVKADPNFALALARLSYAESQLAWYSGENREQLNAQARADAEQALRLAPNQAATQIALGYVEYYGRGDYPAALEAFAAALKLKPNDTDAWAAQGFVQRRQGRLDAAIASLEQALALDPRNSELACELGITSMMASRFPEAEQALQRALALDPNNQNAQGALPYAILFASGDLPKALAAAQGDSVTMKFNREDLLTYQRHYAEALSVLDTIPDTPDNFLPALGGSKMQYQADLYRLMGDAAKARALYARDLPEAHAAIDPRQDKAYQAEEWQRVADDELGLGHVAAGLAAVAKAQVLIGEAKAHLIDLAPRLTEFDAGFYAQARRPDLAVPLLAKALAMPSVGESYAPVMLWLDPMWDPIRNDPGFKELLEKYAKYKPAVIYPAPSASAASTTAASAAH